MNKLHEIRQMGVIRTFDDGFRPSKMVLCTQEEERKGARTHIMQRRCNLVIRVSHPHCPASNGSGTGQTLLRRQAGTDPGKRRARWPLLSLWWRDQVPRLSLRRHCQRNPYPDDMEHDQY